MPSEAPSLPTQTEKPHHYMYLKEFRTQQCPLFLQHKCTQHRPYTCFHWHFMNQRRRRPIRKRDGTFNYSPDVYCSKYDETTGLCPEGDECPNLHRTAGDTERRYHLRYYKTGTCVHETDSKGHCTKNGPHCAFAHGAEDMRPPVHDVRELQTMETPDKTSNNLISAPSSLEKEKILSEDPKWNDTNYVLANYKTEACKRPPRLCRQGYACPQFHNNRDRRRSPKKHKYRSTPCPNVKHGDDWGDPGQCENGDGCAYCHTRTEQQFHPEIYKSTKCNDMVQTGYCPRGPFCAFAHVEQEMNTERELSISVENSLSAFLTSALPICSSELNSEPTSIPSLNFTSANSHTVMTKFDAKANSIGSITSNHSTGFPEPIGKERSLSSASSITSDTSSMSSLTSSPGYHKAPGSEREDSQALKLRQQLQSIDDDITLDVEERAKRKHNLILLHNLNIGVSHIANNSPYTAQSIASSVGLSINSMSSMSALAPSFYPPGDTVESVVGNALQLTIDDFDMSSIDRELDRDNDSNSVGSSISTGLSASDHLKSFAGRFGTVSGPMSIPHASTATHAIQRGSIGSLSQSPPSPLGSLSSQLIPLQLNQIQHQQLPVQVLAQQKNDQQMEQVAAAFLSQPNPGKFAAPAFTDMNSMSPRSMGTHSPMYSSPLSNNHGNQVPLSVEIQRVQEELALYKSKLSSWEEGYTQAKNACDAWKKEAEEATRRSKISEEEKIQALRHRDEALSQLKQSKHKIDALVGGPFLRCLRPVQELEHLPLPQLRQLQQTLRLDLDRLDKIVYQHSAMKCLLCQDKLRSVVLMPCNHYVVCESCSHTCLECPYCHANVTQRSSLMVPM